jgi:hypothetical protein
MVFGSFDCDYTLFYHIFIIMLHIVDRHLLNSNMLNLLHVVQRHDIIVISNCHFEML